MSSSGDESAPQPQQSVLASPPPSISLASPSLDSHVSQGDAAPASASVAAADPNALAADPSPTAVMSSAEEAAATNTQDSNANKGKEAAGVPPAVEAAGAPAAAASAGGSAASVGLAAAASPSESPDADDPTLVRFHAPLVDPVQLEAVPLYPGTMSPATEHAAVHGHSNPDAAADGTNGGHALSSALVPRASPWAEEGEAAEIGGISGHELPSSRKIRRRQWSDSDDRRSPDSPMSHHARSFLEHEDNVRTVLVWQNLTVTAPIRGTQDKKVLLDNVSGSMTGGMWAIMGPSGCGKSTLLNSLACRLDPTNTSMSGELRLNGRPYQASELKKMSGYVMQDDLLNPNLTARETLHYTAALRLPASMSRAEREARVEEVVQVMGLSQCQHVIVGDPSKKGISGGERRRVCIGMELLTRPTLLFLDEPTSGLDSVTAFALIKLLHGITRTGKCSMLISIHQPQAKLFALFDRLLLLKSGRILFQGSVPQALQLFADCGFPVPRYSNPADHILDVITPPMDLTASAAAAHDDDIHGSKGKLLGDEKKEGDTAALGKALSAGHAETMQRDLAIEAAVADVHSTSPNERELSLRQDQKNEAVLLSKFKQPVIDLGYGHSKPLLLERENVSWLRQLRILILRNMRENMRRKGQLMVSQLQTVIMAVLFAVAYLQIGTGQSSTVRRQPILFFYCVNQGTFGAMMVINSFPAERALMLRERAAGTYYASAYFCAKVLVDWLFMLPTPLLFTGISYFIIGLQPEPGKFFITLVLMILCNLCATGLALMVSAICKTTDMSVTVLPLALEVSRLFGGFYLSPADLPDYFSWLDALSYVKYAYVGSSLNELQGLTLSCTDAQVSAGTCIRTGEETIDKLGLDYISIGGCIGVLIGYLAFVILISYIAVRFIKTS